MPGRNFPDAKEVRMRSLVRRLTFWQGGGGKPIGLGLISEKGKPVWEDFAQEENHAFRRYVYEKLRYRNGEKPNPSGGNLHPSPGPG